MAGGYYSCNVFKEKGMTDEDKEKLAMVENMRMYEHYFQRYLQQNAGCSQTTIDSLKSQAAEKVFPHSFSSIGSYRH
jgi:hypothetical protein